MKEFSGKAGLPENQETDSLIGRSYLPYEHVEEKGGPGTIRSWLLVAIMFAAALSLLGRGFLVLTPLEVYNDSGECLYEEHVSFSSIETLRLPCGTTGALGIWGQVREGS